nr:hypothetical protein [uncultured Carboxylicivirga sp.]
MKNFILKTFVLFACLQFSSPLFSQNDTISNVQQLDLQNKLDGMWQMCNADSTVNYSNGLVSYKIYSKGTYALAKVIKDSNNIALSFFGVYSLENDIYDETPTYTTPNVSSVSGKHFLFKLKIDNDYLVITGINNGFNELWKRVK